MHQKLIRFLQEELAIPTGQITFAQRYSSDPNQLPMILWQYGLIGKEQLERFFDWLETA